VVYIVAYDLKSPNDRESDYQRVIGAIKQLDNHWCHIEKSVWLITSEDSASEIRDELKKSLYPADVLFVAKMSGGWASVNLGTKRADWIKSKVF
jgi:hypothetical protein